VFAASPAELRYGSFHRGDTGGFVFDAAESVALDPEMFTDGPLGGTVTEPRALSEAVKSFVAGLAGPVQEASLVLPDTWLRLIFTEVSELPRRVREREEILRWKLKQLVPFRVEDLRITALPVTPFPGQAESHQMLLAFGIEVLLSQLEDAFATAGVTVGCITNVTFATLASLVHGVAADDLAVLVTVQDDAYTLTYFRSGEPLIYRYKELGGLTLASLSGAVRRDLRMTAGFVVRNYPELPLRRAFLGAPPETEEEWASWLSEELEVPPEPLAFEHFQLTRTQVGPTWSQTAPLLGAAGLEVR
jgi:hypothetical protein